MYRAKSCDIMRKQIYYGEVPDKFLGAEMNITELNIEKNHISKLLGAANPDAALLYLYLYCGNDPIAAEQSLHMSSARFACASAVLRQLGLWQQERQHLLPGERPNYSETDVIRAMDYDSDFRALYGEVQRLLGKSLNTEELKILLGFVRYLGMSGEVICVLICYCKDLARQRGNLRNPSLRSIEKEAYAWSEMGIETLEDAAAYIQKQTARRSQLGQLMKLLQIRGRNLTPGEERYAGQWLEMGFDKAVIETAYERTCLNTGGLNWAYMNKILTRWHEAGIHTMDQLKKGEKKNEVPKGASGHLGSAELEAIANVLQEG